MLRSRKAQFLSAVFSTALVVALGGGQADAMSLKDAISLVITTNPDVGVVVKDRRAIDHELRQAWGLYYPQIDTRADWGPEFSENSTTDDGNATTNQGAHDNGRWLFRHDFEITLQQRIFDGFEAASEVQRQKARVNSGAERVQDQAEVSSLDATEQYLQVVRDRARLSNAEDNIKKHEETLGLVQKRAELGGGNVADVSQAEARLATARSTYTEIQGELREDETKFLQIIGIAAGDLDPVTLDASMVPENVDLSVARGLDGNPKVRLAKYDVERSDAEVRQQESSLYPKLNFETIASTNHHNNGLENTTYNAQFLLVLRYNVYRGGADIARVKEFKERRSESLETLRVAEREVEQEVRSSWAARQTQREAIETLEQQVAANQQTFDGYVQQFDIGQRGLLDVLDAANELFTSNDQLILAKNEELFANYRILAAQGQLVESVGLNYPIEGTPGPVDYETNKAIEE